MRQPTGLFPRILAELEVTELTADMLEDVRERVSKHMRQTTILMITTSEGDSNSDSEPREPWRRGH